MYLFSELTLSLVRPIFRLHNLLAIQIAAIKRLRGTFLTLFVADCPFSNYGFKCEQRCSCENSSRCDPVSGTCLCPLGRTGIRCEKECDAGLYGPDCIHTCNCHNNASCDSVTGCCDCPPGWYGQLCDKGNRFSAQNSI